MSTIVQTYTLKDIYKFYKANGGTLPKHLFKNICCDFNIHSMNKVIEEARSLDMGSNLGYIKIERIARNWSRPQVNWGESNKYKKELLEEGKQLFNEETGEGEKYLIYHTEPFYCRFKWIRWSNRLPNKKLYNFKPTRGKHGVVTKLKEHLAEDETNYIKYFNASS